MAEEEFDFEAEFALLDVGATGSMLRTGSVRPTLLAYRAGAGVEAVALDWADASGADAAFEDARRFLRDVRPLAYAVVATASRNGRALHFHLPGDEVPAASRLLAIALVAQDGRGRSLIYPMRHTGTGEAPAFGMPTVSDGAGIDWCRVGDVWANPFCVGDMVKFRARERAVDPATPLWTAVVELTRMRIHEDQVNADEYMSFLDDLRNGIFVVAGRPDNDPHRVLLRPRTVFNPLGTLSVEASRLLIADRVQPDLEPVGAAHSDANESRAAVQ